MHNKLAWVLAAIFGSAAVIWIAKVVFFPSPTEPAKTQRRSMRVLRSPGESLSLVLGSEPSGGGNAGRDYKAGMDAYEARKDAIEQAMDRLGDVVRKEYKFTAEEVALLEKVADHVSAGAARKEMTFYFELTAKRIDRPYYPFEAERFQRLMHVCETLAYHHVATGGPQEYPQAEKRLFDMLVLGRHMVDERARFHIVERGIGVQLAACDLLTQLYRKWNKPDKASRTADYKGGLVKLQSQYFDLIRIVRGLDARWQAPHPGDIFNLAANHADRAVRVEAIISLGFVKHGRLKRGDRRRVRQLIDRKLASADEIEQAAAQAANDMTSEDIRMMDREYNEGLLEFE